MEFRESQAIYLQIADMLCENVLSGSWKPGDRVKVGHVAHDQVSSEGDVVLVAGRKVVEHANPMPGREETVGQV